MIFPVFLFLLFNILSGTWPVSADCGCKHLKRGQTEREHKKAVETCEFESAIEDLISTKNIHQVGLHGLDRSYSMYAFSIYNSLKYSMWLR